MAKIETLLKEALESYQHNANIDKRFLNENIEMMQHYAKEKTECPYGASIRLVRLLKSLGWEQ